LKDAPGTSADLHRAGPGRPRLGCPARPAAHRPVHAWGQPRIRGRRCLHRQCQDQARSDQLVLSRPGPLRHKNIDTRTIVIEGTGKDPKGSGAASATVTAVLTQDGGSTTVATTTDLDVTGRPAQFGRGVMNDVANKLVGQFAANLDALLTSGDREAATPGHPTPAASTPTPGASGAIGQLPQAATPAAGDELDVFALLGLSPVARRRWPPRSSSPTCSCWAGLSAGSATAASLTAEGHPKTRTVNPATGGSSRPTTPRISMRSLACSPPVHAAQPGWAASGRGRIPAESSSARRHRLPGGLVARYGLAERRCIIAAERCGLKASRTRYTGRRQARNVAVELRKQQLWACGAVVARVAYNDEVTGSSPVTPTPQPRSARRVALPS
jgi:hypothetical protein